MSAVIAIDQLNVLMIRIVTCLYSFFVLNALSAMADTYPEVLFENSVMRDNYFYSQVSYSGSSWVENVDGRLPVSDSLYFTPGNALSLTYSNDREGDWQVSVAYPGDAGYFRPEPNYVLTFKLYVATDTEVQVLPDVALYRGEDVSASVSPSKYITDFQSNMWINVRIPVRDFRMDGPVGGIRFTQGATGEGIHRIYLDQIEFLPANPPRVKLSSPAVLSVAKAFERHVDLVWQLPLTPSIRYIKIYRSEDKEHFEPVAIRPIYAQKCTDVVPYTNRTYYYKVAWVDYDYLESPFSNVLEVTVHPMDNETFLDVIQAAHLNFFLERAEVNSGMHAVRFNADDATVSVKETGLSILAQLVGVHRGFIPRQVMISRLERVLDFLDKTPRYNGAFPALIDGRTGKGIFEVDTVPQGDLRATAFLIQGLLTAERYFADDSVATAALSDRINRLWREVAWDRFVVEGREHILLDRWSPISGFRGAEPLGGFGKDFVCYVLALASPVHSLSEEAYERGLGVRRTVIDSLYAGELAGNPVFTVQLSQTAELPNPYDEKPYGSDTTIYGLPVLVSAPGMSLLEAYEPFLVFDPRHKRDQFADYFVNNINLTRIRKRQDNEQGLGASPDVWGRVAGIPDTLCAVSPAVAAAAYGYVPDEAVRSMRVFYDRYGTELFTEYGFRSWVSFRQHAAADSFDALEQAAVVIMIENGRSGLLWELFASHPDVQRVVQRHFSQNF